jgi:hypothetical protein
LILARATGPALNASSLAGLAKPQLELYRLGTSPAATNDDWPNALAAVFSLVGAAPLATVAKGTAAIVTIRAGPGYPTQVSGSTRGTGFS